MASALINALTGTIRQEIPEFKLRYKNESLFMRFLAVLVYPFNQSFIEGYITTIGATVYFPERESLEGRREDDAAATMAHEFVHMWDSKRQWLRYNLGYLSPQIFLIPLLIAYAVAGSWVPVAAVVGALTLTYLALWATMKVTKNKRVRLGVFYALLLVALGGYFVLSVWLSGWWALLAAGSFIPLGPWPSPWRAKWEYRGYGMSIAWEVWRDGDVSDRHMASMASRFTGMDYFRMDPNEDQVARQLGYSLLGAKSGDVLVGDIAEPYRIMHAHLASGGLLRANNR